MKILVVDDEPMLLEILSEFLEEQGYDVEQAESAEEALKFFLNAPESYDLVLTDIKMPVMSGFDLLRQIRSENYDTPVIMMSGHVEGEIDKKAEEMGVSACLLKPFDFSKLFSILSQYDPAT